MFFAFAKFRRVGVGGKVYCRPVHDAEGAAFIDGCCCDVEGVISNETEERSAELHIYNFWYEMKTLFFFVE